MLPLPRVRLKNVPYKNQSLQDILPTCAIGAEIVQLQRMRSGKHNTRLVIIVDKGKFFPGIKRFDRRVQFYDRLKLESILPPYYELKSTIEETIHDLNVYHRHDFNLDDLEIINGKLEAKKTSLGYYSNRYNDDEGIFWDESADTQMWSPYTSDFMWSLSGQFPENEEMVGDNVTERQFKQGLVYIMNSVRNKVDSDLLGSPNGIATLDETGKISIDQVPICIYFNEPNW